MADWTDGAQYAPVARPDAFAAPRVDALAATEPAPNPADGRPAVAPRAYDTDESVPLAELTPHEGPHRDPSEPFETAARSGFGESAWGSAHAAWQPTMPLAEVPAEAAPNFPPPAGAPVVAVAPGQQPAPTPQAPTVLPLPPGTFGAPTGSPVPLPPPVANAPQGLAAPGAAPVDPWVAQQPPAFPQPAPQAPTQPDAAPAASPQSTADFPPPMPTTRPPAAMPPMAGNPFDPANFAPAPNHGSHARQGQHAQQGHAPPHARPQQPTSSPAVRGVSDSRRPLPERLTAQAVFTEAGLLPLAVLGFGVVVWPLSYIMLLIASMLHRRHSPTNRTAAGLFSLALWVVLVVMVVDAFLYPDWAHVGPAGRWACAAMIPLVLLTTWDDLRQRMAR